MPQAPLTDDELRQTYELVVKHGSVTDAGMAAGANPATFSARWRRAKQWAHAQGLSIPSLQRHAVPSRAPRLAVSADECWEQLDEFIGRARTPKPKPRKWKPGKEQRITIAGDFHAPFHDPESVAALIAAESATTDTLIINGDLMDFYSISRFIKYERVPIEQELAAADALLGHLAAAFPDVLIVEGNHDAPRFDKAIRSLLSPEMMHVIEYLSGGNLSVVRAMAKRYPNVRFAPHGVGRFSMGWLSQVGDLLVTHTEKYSKVPSSALRGIDEWLTDQHETLGLQPWRVLVQAHTHQGGVFPWKADRLLVEGGCMCSTHSYQLTARIAGRPQRVGYVTLVQHGGATDINSVRFHWLNATKRDVA